MYRFTARSGFLGSLVLACAAGGVASAQPTTSTYNVTHQYWFNAGALPPIALLNYSVSARAFEPAPGWDSRSVNGQWGIFGSGAFSLFRSAGTDRAAPGFIDAGATAGVSATVQNWGGGIYQATMNSSGIAHAQFSPPNQAIASSNLSTTIFAGRSWAAGQLRWTPIIADTVSGNASVMRTRNLDPITFEVYDDVGNLVIIDSFFDVYTELSSSMTWDANGLETGALTDMTLSIDVPTSPFMDISGRLDLQVIGGTVTQSSATGMFAGAGLPGIGADLSGGLFLPGLSNEFEFNYDFSSLANADSFVIHLSGGGFTAIPAPGSIALIALGGVVGTRRRR